MFITLSEYKKRCDSVLKIAQEISKAYDKDRMKKLIIKQIDKEIGDKTLESINNFRKNNSNLPSLTKEQLKDIILRNINWKGLWCDINGLKETIKKHADYCMKNDYSILLDLADEFGVGDFITYDELKNIKKEKQSNPSKYYSSERGKLIEKVCERLTFDSGYGSSMDSFVENFVNVFSVSMPFELKDKNFDMEIYGVREFHWKINKEKVTKEVKTGFFKKEIVPPSIYELIIDDVFDKEVDEKIQDGFDVMGKYGFIMSNSGFEYDFDSGAQAYEISLIDWVCDNSFRNSQK